jgi:hypothetical protein
MSFFLSLKFFSSTQLENKRVEQVLPGSGSWGWWEVWGEVAQIICTHISKYKNDKNKRRNLKNVPGKFGICIFRIVNPSMG